MPVEFLLGWRYTRAERRSGFLSFIAMIAMCGVALGMILAWILCAEVNPRAFGWSLPFAVSPRLVLETIGLGLLAAVIAGLLPALRMGRRPLAPALRSE